MIKKYLIISLLLLAQIALTQSYNPQKTLDLDPTVMGVASCAGSLNANNVNNYANEIYNIDQLKDAYHVNSLALELAIASLGQNHYLAHVADYAALAERGYEVTIDELVDGNFDWDSQSELDYCQVKIFKYLSEPPKTAFWVGDYETFIKLTRDFSNQTVDQLVEFLDNY
tara:strand:+ start:432 stop:941 length:510 start_codon:yes stop_codon:yes gene_type:complete